LAAALSAALVTAALTMGWAPAQAFAPPGDPLCAHPIQPAGAPVKVLIAGDSITSAAIGDYTWRYFTWKHLMDSGLNVDMVGATKAISDPITYNVTTNIKDYVCGGDGDGAGPNPVGQAADFDRDHYAFPGYYLKRYLSPAWSGGSSNLITQGVTAYTPPIPGTTNVLVLELGVEDLYSADTAPKSIGDTKDTPQQTLTMIQQAIAAARAVNPSIKIVLTTVATLPGTPGPGTTDSANQTNFRAYNNLLNDTYPDADAAASGIALAQTMRNTWGGLDLTYDTQHPNVQGEVDIAYEVDKALHLLGIGDAVPAQPQDVTPYLGPREPADLHAPVVTGNTVKLEWKLPVGSNNSRIERHDVTANVDWAPVPALDFVTLIGCKDQTGKTITTQTDTSLTPPYTCSASDTTMAAGHTYQYRIRLAKSYLFAASLVSNVVPVTAPGTIATPPAKVVAKTPSAIGHGVTVKWTAVVKATSYKVYYGKSASAITSGPKTVNGGSATSLNVTGLAAGTKYYFKVVAHSGAGDAPASNVVSATPAYYVIAAPPKPRLAALARHRIRATWTATAHTTRYLVQVRLGSRIVKQVFVTRNTWSSGALKKKKTYSVRVRPYDGTYAGGVSRASTVKVK
jgi:hypothetical protein